MASLDRGFPFCLWMAFGVNISELLKRDRGTVSSAMHSLYRNINSIEMTALNHPLKDWQSWNGIFKFNWFRAGKAFCCTSKWALKCHWPLFVKLHKIKHRLECKDEQICIWFMTWYQNELWFEHKSWINFSCMDASSLQLIPYSQVMYYTYGPNLPSYTSRLHETQPNFCMSCDSEPII